MNTDKPVPGFKPNCCNFLKLGGRATVTVFGRTALPAVAHAAFVYTSSPKTLNALPTGNLGKTG